MARTLAEGAIQGMNALSGAFGRRALVNKSNFDEQLKLAELKSKGFDVSEDPSNPRGSIISYNGQNPTALKQAADLAHTTAETKQINQKMEEDNAPLNSSVDANGQPDFIKVGGKLTRNPRSMSAYQQLNQDNKTDNNKTPEEKGQEAGIKATAQERAKALANLPGYVRQLSTINDQFDKAFPAQPGEEANMPIARATGAAKRFGSQFGIGLNTDQSSLLKSMPLTAIGLVRAAGAMGRMNTQELSAATKTLSQEGMAPEERMKLARDMSQQAISKMSPDEFHQIVKANPDLPAILSKYGIDTGGFSGKVPEFNSEAEIPPTFKGKAKVGGVIGTVN